MEAKVKDYQNYIKENQQTQAELKKSEQSWKIFSEDTRVLQGKIKALLDNIMKLKDRPDAALYFPLLQQGLQLMKASSMFSTRLQAFYAMQKPYFETLKRMIDKIAEAGIDINPLNPERTVKKFRSIEKEYLPGIHGAKETIDKIQEELFKEREELHALYNSMNQ